MSEKRKASLYKTTGYHVEVDGEVFKSQGAAGYGGGDSSLHDKHRREVAAHIVRCVNAHEDLVEALKSLCALPAANEGWINENGPFARAKKLLALLSKQEETEARNDD